MFDRLLCLLTLLTLLLLLPAAAAARELTLLAGDSIPPYAIAARDSGAEVELLRAAFATQGVTLRFQYVPLARVSRNVGLLEADGATRGSAGAGLFASRPYIRYQACVLGLGAAPQQLADLRRLRVAAFPGARAELGPGFSAAVQGNAHYTEINNQLNQLNLLRLGRVDVVVADRLIANWHWQALHGEPPLRCLIPLPSQSYQAVFRRAADAEAFDAGLLQLRASGDYRRLMEKYGTLGVD